MPVDVDPPTNSVGLRIKPLSSAALTVIVAVLVPLPDPVIVTVVSLLTEFVVIVNVAVLAPPRT